MISPQGRGTGLVVGSPLQHAPPQSVLDKGGSSVKGMCVCGFIKEGMMKAHEVFEVKIQGKMFEERIPDGTL